jgi:hypothetical protein
MPRTDEAVVPIGAEFIGEFTPRHELGIGFTEPARMTYLDSPVSVYKSSHPAGERFDVVSTHGALDGEQLLGFLKEVAPNKRVREGVEGVVADWNVVDRAHSKDDFYASRAQELVKTHEQLGGSWVEFLRSQPAFLATMEDACMPRFDRHYRGFSQARFLTTAEVAREAPRDIIRQAPASIDGIVGVLESSGIGPEELEAFVVEAVKTDVNAKRRSHQAPVIRRGTLEDKYSRWSKSMKRGFLKGLIERMPEEQRDILMARARENMYDTVTLPSGEEIAYPRNLLPGTLADALEDRAAVVDGAYEGQFVKLRNKDGKVADALVPGSVRRLTPASRVSPLLAWTRTGEGERRFVFERKTTINDGIQFRDGVLGALAVAYFSPDVRAEWPEYMSIRGSRKQVMGPAQVPVLVLMRKAQILKADFIEAAESAAV